MALCPTSTYQFPLVVQLRCSYGLCAPLRSGFGCVGQRARDAAVELIREGRKLVVALPPVGSAHDLEITITDELGRGFEVPTSLPQNVVHHHAPQTMRGPELEVWHASGHLCTLQLVPQRLRCVGAGIPDAASDLPWKKLGSTPLSFAAIPENLTGGLMFRTNDDTPGNGSCGPPSQVHIGTRLRCYEPRGAV